MGKLRFRKSGSLFKVILVRVFRFFVVKEGFEERVLNFYSVGFKFFGYLGLLVIFFDGYLGYCFGWLRFEDGRIEVCIGSGFFCIFY